MQFATFAGIATCLVVAVNPLLAGDDAVADTPPAGILDDVSPLELTLRPDDEATEIGFAPRHDEHFLADSTLATGLSDFQWQPDALALGAFQDEPGAAAPPSASGGNLAEQATNPVAPLIQLQLQNNFVGESNAGSGYSNQFVVQPVIPYKLFDQNFLTRITLPLLVATPDLGDPINRKYGLGDTVALNALVWNIKEGPWKGMWGPILTLTAPTATSDFLGEGKWQAGPGFIYINTATKGVQWGIFGYQQWSFASSGGDSDRKEVSKLFFQPILVLHFNEGWYVASQDILWTVDFNNNTWSLPVGVRIGKVGKIGGQQVNVFVEPYYDVSSNNPGNEWGVKLNVTLLFPQ